MTSLMSVFDPCVSLIPNLGWSVAMFGILLKFKFWNSLSSLTKFLEILTSSLMQLFKGKELIFLTLFFFVLNMNIMGLLPMVFSPTSHLSFNLVLSLSLWIGMMLKYMKTNLSQFLTHLTPMGCPLILAPALVLIELVSSLIRPITLSLRLMANVMAGHMILTLMSKGVTVLSPLMLLPLFLVLVGFMAFEFGVALIQSYVFSSLMYLYWDESESSH